MLKQSLPRAGLPGGLTLELDGDTVVSAKTGSLTGPRDLLQNGQLAAAEYVAALGAQMPLATVAYQLLACRAIEAAARATPTDDTKTARSAALAHGLTSWQHRPSQRANRARASQPAG